MKRGCGLAVGLAVLAAFGSGTSTATARPAFDVISPLSDSALPARPALLRVRVRRGAKQLRATLNGRPVGRYLSRGRRGVRRAWLSPSHGLRFGRNVLRVSAGRGDGGRRGRVVRFRVRGRRPLAAAGVDRVASHRERLVLDGSESRLPSGGRGSRLRFHWSFAGGPRQARAARRAGVRLLRRNSPRPVLRLRDPGSFPVRLRVTGPRGATGTDVVGVRVDPPPSVRLEAGVRRGAQTGVALNGPLQRFFPGDPSKWLQVVVLERDSLGLVSNRSYDCPQASEHRSEAEASFTAPCAKALRADLGKLGPTEIAIAVSLPGAGGAGEPQPPVGVSGALGEYVAPWSWWASARSIARGTFSAVFVPGLKGAGVLAQFASPTPEAGGSGLLDDNLVRDNEGNYAIVSGDRRRYEAQAADSTAERSVVAIGDREFVQPLPKGSKGGFQVVLVDARTLDGRSQWFETHGRGAGLAGLHGALARASQSAQFGPRTLAFVVSRGDPAVSFDDGTYPWFDQLGEQIEALGGTRTRLFAALDSRISKGRSYTLVGEGGLRRSEADEVLGPGPATPGSLNTAPLSGVVSRSAPLYQYEIASTGPPSVGAGAALDAGAAQLLAVSGQAPTPWPEQGNAGRSAAIEYVGTEALGTSAPRTQYWTRIYVPSDWASIRREIGALRYPGGKPGFAKKDLQWAQAELLREIGWLETTYSYAGVLAQPFDKSEFQSWAALTAIAARIGNEVGTTSEEKVNAVVDAIVEFAVDIGEEAPVIGKAVGAVSALYRFAMAAASIDGESVDTPFAVSVGEVGEAFTRRLGLAQSQLANGLPDAIVADYGRLRTVGSCAAATASAQAGCPFDPAGWQYTQRDAERTAQTLIGSSKAAAFSAIMPAKYTAYELPLSTIRKATTFSGLTFAVVCHWPFADSPASSQYARPVFKQIGLADEDRRETYAIRALGFLKGEGTVGRPYEMVTPPRGLTDQIFGTGPDDLGLDPEDFFNRSFEARIDLHFPWKASPTGWLSRCSGGPGVGSRLDPPARYRLGRAVRRGIPVPFEVSIEGATVRLLLTVGGPGRGRGADAPRLVIGRLRLRNLAAGRYPATLRIPPAGARAVRRTGLSRATLRMAIFPPDGGAPQRARRSVVLRYVRATP